MFSSYKSYLFDHLEGKKNPGTGRSSVESFLDRVSKAKEMKIDKYILIHIILFQFSNNIL